MAKHRHRGENNPSGTVIIIAVMGFVDRVSTVNHGTANDPERSAEKLREEKTVAVDAGSHHFANHRLSSVSSPKHEHQENEKESEVDDCKQIEDN